MIFRNNKGINYILKLIPINKEEKEIIEQEEGTKSIYTLYRSNYKGGIQIGNSDVYDKKEDLKGYFYNLNDSLLEEIFDKVNRPIYRVSQGTNNTIENYAIINETEENNFKYVWIDSILDGSFEIKKEESKTLLNKRRK